MLYMIIPGNVRKAMRAKVVFHTGALADNVLMRIMNVTNVAMIGPLGYFIHSIEAGD